MLDRPAGPAARRGIVKEHCEDGFMLTKSYFGPVKMNFFIYCVEQGSTEFLDVFFLTD